VHNTLDTADGPEPSDETVEIRARTSYGDILIRRLRRHPDPPGLTRLPRTAPRQDLIMTMIDP
jgi:hypothetical protein